MDFPSLNTDIKADIKGDSATVSVTQTFINPTNKPVHAKYLFPLSKDAAINSMVMEMGEEIVEAIIKEKEEAKEIYDDAKREGRAASLLEQHRPNMFTQNIANLVPGLPIKVTIKYVQKISKVDNDYELVVPLIVGPRYIPRKSIAPTVAFRETNGENRNQNEDTPKYGQWNVSDIPPYPPLMKIVRPTSIEPSRVSIKVTLESGTPIGRLYSDTHRIKLSGEQFKKEITLSKSSIIDNRDFILRYNLGGSKIQGGFLAHKTNKKNLLGLKPEENFFSLMIEPPMKIKEENVIGRELVFVIDTSGSMSGEPIETSKAFMSYALKNLRQNDSFRIIKFSDNPAEYYSGSVPATHINKKRALRFISSLEASGGTELAPAMKQAFSVAKPLNMLQVIVILSDGYVGNEPEILRLINQRMNSNSRLYSFGIGTSVNRYLLSEMAYIGRGIFRVINPTENITDSAIKFANKIKSPLLTNIKIDWGKLEVSDVTPKIIPDLWAGETVRIYGKFKGTESQNIKVVGLVKGGKASLPIKASLQSNTTAEENGAIPLIWARSKISDYMRLKNTPEDMRIPNISDSKIRGKVIDLGLKYSLMTKWTSFVAVSRKVVNPNPMNTSEAQVPLPKVKGITYNAYGNILAQNFSGSSVPEPETVFGLALILFLGVLVSTRMVKTRLQASSKVQGVTL